MSQETTATPSRAVQTGQTRPPIMRAGHGSSSAAVPSCVSCYPGSLSPAEGFCEHSSPRKLPSPLFSAFSNPCVLVCYAGHFLFIQYLVSVFYPNRKVPLQMQFSKFQVSGNFVVPLGF